MEVFFTRYRKILFIASIYMFLYFLYEMYRGVGIIRLSKTGEGIGTLVDAVISLFVAVYFFINVRKANKALNDKSAI
jgi:hypothetical protein